MKRFVTKFLLLAYLICCLCFCLPLCLSWNFHRMLAAGWFLFVLGGLGPALAAMLIFCLHRRELGGVPGLLRMVCRGENAKSRFLVPIFLALHFGFALLLGALRPYDSPAQYLGYALPAFLLFGSQELGWSLILQPGLEEGRPFWKATAAAGLFTALWFLPLLLLNGFPVSPDSFLHWAAYLVGLRFLLAVLRRKGGSVLACCVFAGLFYAFTALLRLRLDGLFFAVAALDLAICFLYSGRPVKEKR